MPAKKGTIVFIYTWFPTQKDLNSPATCGTDFKETLEYAPNSVPTKKNVAQEEIEGRNISEISMVFSNEVSGEPGD